MVNAKPAMCEAKTETICPSQTTVNPFIPPTPVRFLSTGMSEFLFLILFSSSVDYCMKEGKIQPLARKVFICKRLQGIESVHGSSAANHNQPCCITISSIALIPLMSDHTDPPYYQ
jgi:hypothetical protein